MIGSCLNIQPITLHHYLTAQFTLLLNRSVTGHASVCTQWMHSTDSTCSAAGAATGSGLVGQEKLVVTLYLFNIVRHFIYFYTLAYLFYRTAPHGTLVENPRAVSSRASL